MTLEPQPIPTAGSRPVPLPVPPERHHERQKPHIRTVEVDWDRLLPPAAGTARWKIGQAVKRAIDILGALTGLVVLSPVLVILALLVKLTTPGPVIFPHPRVGFRGRVFTGYKLRSMVENAECLKPQIAHMNHMRGAAFKIRNDPRVTPFGRFIRRFSLDELPQLWNVVIGDMSLVGPRPPLLEDFSHFEERHLPKLAVRPGITCYWQVNGRSEIADYDEWVRLDMLYIEGWSLWTDFKILLRTVPAVLKGRGAY